MTNEELAVKIQSGESDLIDELWVQNESLCRMKAYRVYNHHRDRCIQCGVTEDDILQVGFMALYEAVQAYKPDGGYKLLSYINYPLKSRVNELLGYRGRRELLNECDSLDKPIDSDDGGTLTDITPDPDGENGIDDVIETEFQRELRRDINTALSMLSDDERDVIHERFWNGKTFTDISAMHGTTVQEVRSVESKALNTLRKPKALKHLNAYRQDIIDRYSYRGSLDMWRNSHTSSTERTVLKFEELDL